MDAERANIRPGLARHPEYGEVSLLAQSDLGALSLVGIARVELVLGPASVLYGSDAIGGVISLTSVGRGAQGFHGETCLKGHREWRNGQHRRAIRQSCRRVCYS